MFKATFVLAFVLLSGCAQMVTKNYTGVRGGTVKYNPGFLMAEKNRTKAIEMAREYCGRSRMVINAEDTNSEFTGHTSMNMRTKGRNSYGSSTQSKSDVTYIHFSCGRSTPRVAAQ